MAEEEEEEENHHQHDLKAAFRKGKKKLSLESYYGVLASGDCSFLTKVELNQILSIHGFKKIRNPKIEIEETVRRLELKDFSRSTINESIQPAPMSLTDAIKDLTQLNWQTCPVVSVRSIGPTHNHNTGSSTCNPVGFESKNMNTKSTGSSSKQRKSGESNRSRDQACSVAMAVTAPNSLTSALKDEEASKQLSCAQSVGMDSSGGDRSVYCFSSSSMAEEIEKRRNKRKRKLNKASLVELLSRTV